MISRITLITATAVFCSGCATVDLQSMAGPQPDTSDAIKSDTNVVQRAVERLKAAFASRGFGAKSSQKKMQAAADMLLRGMTSRVSQNEGTSYADRIQPVSVVLEDIALAQRHVSQTHRAAVIYLDVARHDEDLSDELESLQAALLASDRAVKLFDAQLSDPSAEGLAGLRLSVEQLRQVTDRFGDRVRQAHVEKSKTFADDQIG